MTQTAGVRIPRLSEFPSLSGHPFPSSYDTGPATFSPCSAKSLRTLTLMGLPPQTPPSCGSSTPFFYPKIPSRGPAPSVPTGETGGCPSLFI